MPQLRLIRQAVEIIHEGGVVAYPTDSSYALGCALGDKDAMERIRNIRKVDKEHNFTLVCQNLAELSIYADCNNDVYRLLKRFTPGAYTFILIATSEVPRRLQHPKRRSIGLRIPDHRIVSTLLGELAQPLASSTLIMPGEELPLNDPQDIRQQLEKLVDLTIDGGTCDGQPTSVVDLTTGVPIVRRKGKADITPFL